MARKTSPRTKQTAAGEAPDLHALLLDALKAQGIEPRVRWAPSKNYASLLVDGQNIGYVFAQKRTGVRVEPAAAMADLAGTRSPRFALVGVITTEPQVKHAAAGLVAGAKKAAKSDA
jgi:hypothetical protein